ncbi:MAG: TonB-dependent receptor [Bacteroidetes bacterium]|nr:MAG: TonB-dependent receptor [Bacteroidota bacterium]
MKTINYITLLSILFLSWTASAQEKTQTIRGTVVDKVSQSPLMGVTVVLLNSEPLKGTVTDLDGNFSLSDVPVGNQGLKFTYIGYQDIMMENLFLAAGKEMVLRIQMEESFIESAEAVVTAKTDKATTQNDMLTVSSRTFSVEETQRYAAAVNDPLRMSLSFAGVVSTQDGNNSIAIRGNSPRGLLWRMEGVDIPNPNHFSEVGASAGGISILSSQLLSNSDFSTGAFSAEYGNALSGVFDLSLRKGNNQKREHTFRAGVLGIDLATEGPIKKGYAGSYLVNYRYSTLGLLGKMGVNIGDATTNFQDLSYHVYLPSQRYGSFSFFGFGGLSAQFQKAIKDTSEWSLDAGKQYDWRFGSNTGAAGMSHKYNFNNHNYLKTSLVLSGVVTGYKEEKLDEQFNSQVQYKDRYFQGKATFMTTLNSKFSSRLNQRSGIIISRVNFNMSKNVLDDSTQQLVEFLNNEGHTYTYQAFSQWRYRATERLTAQVGLHFLSLGLNGSSSVEPRASLAYDINSRSKVSLGYGLHSQVQSTNIYFVKTLQSDGTYAAKNKNLDLSKAHHLVLGYDYRFSQDWHAKVEVYYQHLYNIPVGTDTAKMLSALNTEYGSGDFEMVNGGLGRNYGIELTVEKFFTKNWYMLFSASLYDSKYRALDGSWFDTRFNGNRTLTLTGGKEWQLSAKRKNRIVGFNLKAIYAGGLRNTPIDLQQSISQGEAVRLYDQSYTLQNPDYFRVDLGFSVRRNYKRSTGTLSLDIQNVANHSNVGGVYYDNKTMQVRNWYQTGLIPVLSYKLEF